MIKSKKHNTKKKRFEKKTHNPNTKQQTNNQEELSIVICSLLY